MKKITLIGTTLAIVAFGTATILAIALGWAFVEAPALEVDELVSISETAGVKAPASPPDIAAPDNSGDETAANAAEEPEMSFEQGIFPADLQEMEAQSESARPALGTVLFNFDGNEPAWYTVNDDVMGGVSSSLVTIDQANRQLAFSGNLSVENNGGFASIRSQWTDYDLAPYVGIVLRVRGDGNIYRFRIRTEETGSQIAYTAAFETSADWQEVFIPFAEMVPLYRGFVVNQAGPLDPSTIRSFGFMLTDKQEGSFELEVDWISALTAVSLSATAL